MDDFFSKWEKVIKNMDLKTEKKTPLEELQENIVNALERFYEANKGTYPGEYEGELGRLVSGNLIERVYNWYDDDQRQENV